MRIITERGLRKHLDEKVIVGKNAYEIFRAGIDKEGPGEIGTLLEDDLGFYLQVNEVRNSLSLTEISHVRRINQGDTIAIIYKPQPWRTYYVDLE